jgi:pyridinium-3,5-biscarboxylic acid mononucleotide sulfurtransferase
MLSERMAYSEIIHAFPKMLQLHDILTDLLTEGLLVAFSGGVDSSFLLWAAAEALACMQANGKDGKLEALFTISPSVPTWDREDAVKIADILKINLIIVDSHELQEDAYAKNEGMRCYYCKSELFKIAKEIAKQKNCCHIAYGYNASDRHDVRPGHHSAKENGIHSPLDQANIEKQEIRNLLKQIGLNVADKASSPCLASRMMTGVRVTEEKLQHIQVMENMLRAAGLHLYRVRMHEEMRENKGINQKIKYFRIEVAPEEMPNILQIRETLVHEAQKMGYRWVNLDLAGYRMGGGNLV